MTRRKCKPAEVNNGGHDDVLMLPSFHPSGVCRVCGCTQDHACPGGCWWTEDDLCSECDPRITPKVGGRVTVAGETREIESVDAVRGVVIYSWPGKIAVRTLRIAAWRTWAQRGAAA